MLELRGILEGIILLTYNTIHLSLFIHSLYYSFIRYNKTENKIMPRNQGTSRKGKPKKEMRSAGFGKALQR